MAKTIKGGFTSTKPAATSELEALVRRYQSAAAELLPAQTDADELDPDALQSRGTAAIAQLVEAEADGTPELLLVEEGSSVHWTALLAALIDQARHKANEPGARTMPPAVPPENRIDPAVQIADAARRRVVQIIDSRRRQPDEVEALKLAILGNRKSGSGRARWLTDINSIIAAVEDERRQVPAALRGLLPRLHAAAEQLANARAQSPGRQKGPTFSTGAREAALALDLALADLCAWSGGFASEKRNGNLLRIIEPKRRGDARSGDEKGSGGGTGDGVAEGAGSAG